MIKLQIYRTYGGIDHLENELDASQWTLDEIAEVIAKQESVYPGCWHRLKRYPPKPPKINWYNVK